MEAVSTATTFKQTLPSSFELHSVRRLRYLGLKSFNVLTGRET
jgi:hypothetical protein